MIGTEPLNEARPLMPVTTRTISGSAKLTSTPSTLVKRGSLI